MLDEETRRFRLARAHKLPKEDAIRYSQPVLCPICHQQYAYTLGTPFEEQAQCPDCTRITYLADRIIAALQWKEH